MCCNVSWGCGRWLFYFLARQKQAEAAIEAYKVVDKQALAQLSPTCLSELFRSLIDNEIITQVRRDCPSCNDVTHVGLHDEDNCGFAEPSIDPHRKGQIICPLNCGH
jgi:hypothetical protein